jgi:phage replication initiation protein
MTNPSSNFGDGQSLNLGEVITADFDAAYSGGAAPSAAAQATAEGGSPRPVIRGESTPSGAIIDWLRFSFLPSGSISSSLDQLHKYMRLWFPVPVNFVHRSTGLFTYETAQDVMMWANGEMIRIGSVCMGGDLAGGTMLVDLTGMGCSLVEDWQAVFVTMQDLDARITRADVALDLMQGYTVEQFDDMYSVGQFNCGGRIPIRKMVESGDLSGRDRLGKTLYLGKKKNGKELCIYQKGRQLGNQDSEWVRVEVRFGSKDRVIPHDIVLNPNKYFAGAYIALQYLIDTIPQKILTDKKELATQEFDMAMAHLLHYCKIAYGKLFSCMEAKGVEGEETDYKALFESVRVKGVPRRLEKSTVAGGMNREHDPSRNNGDSNGNDRKSNDSRC